ncbi:hypothetical protein VP01_2281g1 [Puccinia sorghi]|uniref:Uncharacterized protein n=1 Tax=Puccinia sorghi TaxID=27349 RepID=A0A0L6V8A2_9BASI|nr:hypothetical protein VP01_2281g1 [Puccinia sorghi]
MMMRMALYHLLKVRKPFPSPSVKSHLTQNTKKIIPHSSADHNSENVNNPSDQSIPFPPLDPSAFSHIIPNFLCEKIHALATKLCSGHVKKEKWNHGFEGVLYLLNFCLETLKKIKLPTAIFIYHKSQFVYVQWVKEITLKQVSFS